MSNYHEKWSQAIVHMCCLAHMVSQSRFVLSYQMAQIQLLFLKSSCSMSTGFFSCYFFLFRSCYSFIYLKFLEFHPLGCNNCNFLPKIYLCWQKIGNPLDLRQIHWMYIWSLFIMRYHLSIPLTWSIILGAYNHHSNLIEYFWHAQWYPFVRQEYNKHVSMKYLFLHNWNKNR